MKKYESGKFYDSHNDKIGFDEFKSPIEDDLNDDFNKNYVKCNCLKCL